ncbi:uncharacterized protein LOC114298042 [Camellia sinensis]|uniref:uncharacterized protein LOC114298042 n=1 Tax=Camellia sinensis TaxID=4442 RepID=UPI0010369F53|nr:uncharacterized protein LOC114298042 [Camellia sinensis]
MARQAEVITQLQQQQPQQAATSISHAPPTRNPTPRATAYTANFQQTQGNLVEPIPEQVSKAPVYQAEAPFGFEVDSTALKGQGELSFLFAIMVANEDSIVWGGLPTVVREYLNIFLEDLTGYHHIERLSCTTPIFMAPYRFALAELRELKTNILVYSPSKKEHERHLQVGLELLRSHRLFAKFKKCEFWLKEIKFLGHVVSGERVIVDSFKIDVVHDWEQPKNTFEIQSFLGLAEHY